MAFDIASLCAVWGAALVAVPGSLTARLVTVAVAVASTVSLLVLQQLYETRVWAVPLRVARAVVVGTAVAAVVGHALGGGISRTRYIAAGVGAVALLMVVRSAHAGWLRARRAAGHFMRPVVLVGGNDEGVALAELIRVHPELGYRVVGVIAPPGGVAPQLEAAGVPWLGGFDDALRVIQESGAAVIIAGTAVPYLTLQRITRELVAGGLDVQLSAGLYGVDHRRLRWQPLGREPLVYVQPVSRSRYQAAGKRFLDVALASIGLVVALPVMLVAALAIKLEGGGPVLFAHERVGQNGKHFRLLKLRTMVLGAEHRLADVRDANDRRGGPLFKLERDPRVTRVGRFLRESSIDELPQLINVLRGHMSLVGPRPALPAEAALFDEELRSRRLAVRPGVTGLWQVDARDNPEFSAYRRLDLFYVENWSIGFDLAILWMTLGRVLGRLMRVLRGRPRRAVGSRVLIIVQNMSVPLDRRVWQECQALVAAGFGVSVICPRGPGEAKREEIAGVRIHRYAPPPAARGILGYAIEFVYCWVRTAVLSVRIARRDGFDAVQACNPPDTYWALALFYKLIGKRFIFDQHDLNPEVYASRFGTENGLLYRGLCLLERASYRLADHVIVTNDSYRDVALRRGRLTPDAVTVVRSGPDTSIMRRAATVPALRQGRKHLCVYLGIMGPQDGVGGALHALRRLVDSGRDDVHLALLGYGDCLGELRSLSRELGLDDFVTFTGRADGEMIRDYLSTAVVGLSPDPLSPLNDVSTMNKTLEYMAYELPVVAFDLKETRVSAGDAAVYVPSGDIDGFAAAIAELVDDDVRRRAMGRYGRQRIESALAWEHQAPQYVSVYRSLLVPPRWHEEAAGVSPGPLAAAGVALAPMMTGGRAS